MSRKSIVIPLLALTALIVASLACGGSNNTGEKVDEEVAAPTSVPAQVEVFKVGDVIQVKDHTIVLNNTTFTGSILQANFTIENKGAEEMNVSSWGFDARDSEGTNLDEAIFDCGASLGGKILTGDKLRGNICWKEATSLPIKIYYEAELFGSGAVVWQIDE